jgi:hypothetical protein
MRPDFLLDRSRLPPFQEGHSGKVRLPSACAERGRTGSDEREYVRDESNDQALDCAER